MKLLGCCFEVQDSKLKLNNEYPVFSLPDPCHMVKLICNFFAEKGGFTDEDGGIIKYQYLTELCNLQESEGLHLANKLRRQHIDFFRQKMKVKLAVQLLSRSVAQSLLFCKNVLKLSSFKDVEPTVKFITLVNDVFDILKSRQLNAFGFKKSLCNGNISNIKDFIKELNIYIKKLTLVNGTPVLNSNRKTGFVGILMALKSVVEISEFYILETQMLRFLPTYKLSQDHLEIFFGSIWAQGGFNNNPTSRQFTSA